MKYQIVFQKDDFIIVNKPSGLLTVPPRMPDNREILGKILEKDLQCQIFPVHRLDFEVSGLVLFATSAQAHREASLWFENKLVQKTYQALTEGPTLQHLPDKNRRHSLLTPQMNERFVWKSSLLKGKKRTYHHKDGKPSITNAQYLGQNLDSFHQWILEPVTGRSHQLRYELSVHGFPIVGDELYGSRVKLSHQIKLHAFRLVFLENQLPPMEIPGIF